MIGIEVDESNGWQDDDDKREINFEEEDRHENKLNLIFLSMT